MNFARETIARGLEIWAATTACKAAGATDDQIWATRLSARRMGVSEAKSLRALHDQVARGVPPRFRHVVPPDPERWKVTWTWTNWTFGVWWSDRLRGRPFGVDLGPLEIVYHRKVIT